MKIYGYASFAARNSAEDVYVIVRIRSVLFVRFIPALFRNHSPNLRLLADISIKHIEIWKYTQPNDDLCTSTTKHIDHIIDFAKNSNLVLNPGRLRYVRQSYNSPIMSFSTDEQMIILFLLCAMVSTISTTEKGLEFHIYFTIFMFIYIPMRSPRFVSIRDFLLRM